MKKLISAALTLALLVALTGASASGAGTAKDPLITKEYADAVYAQSLLSAGSALIQSTVADLNAALDTLIKFGDNRSLTQGREAFVCSSRGGNVTLGQGGSFILTSGTVTVTFNYGEVIDTSTGMAVASGASLDPLTRYFVTEGMVASFTASPSALFFLDGPYRADPDIYRQYEQYEDVQGGEWFSDPVRYSYAKKLFHDWNAPLFRPLEVTTRAEMIYVLWVSAGCPKTTSVSPFTDLTEEWYVDAVNWAYEHGITQGAGAADRFNPNGLLSRQEVVTMYYRWSADRGMDVSGRTDLTVFPDYASIDAWAEESASWAAYVGLIQGRGDHTFGPMADICRADLATIAQRYEPLGAA